MGLSVQYFLTLVRRWWIPLFLVPVACGMLALGLGMSRTPMYASTATLLVSVPASTTLDDYNANLLARDLRETYQTLVTTDPVLNAVAASVTPPTTADRLRESITVSESSGALFLITVVDSDPARAATLVNALSVELTRFAQDLGGVDSGEGNATLTTVVQGTVSDSPYAPRIPAYLALGIVGGLVLSVFGIALAETLDTRLRPTTSLNALAGLRPLAHIPRIRQRLTGPATLFLDNQDAWEAAESVRGVRNVIIAAKGADRGSAITIASPDTGDGKSLVAANLAEAMARTGKLVFLVDGNLHDPGLNAIYDVDAPRGLGELVEDPDLTWAEVAVRVRENLVVIPAGTSVRQPSDLLMSVEFGQLVDDLCAAADVVIVDTPALEEATDAVAAAMHTDQVILVCRIGRTRVADLVRARERFDETGTPILGVVMNGGAGFHFRDRFRRAATFRRPAWRVGWARRGDAIAPVSPGAGHVSNTAG